MNDPMHKERALQAEIQADQQALEVGLDRARQFERNVQSELASLESELPDVLFDSMMNGADKSRKREIRQRVADAALVRYRKACRQGKLPANIGDLALAVQSIHARPSEQLHIERLIGDEMDLPIG